MVMRVWWKKKKPWNPIKRQRAIPPEWKALNMSSLVRIHAEGTSTKWNLTI